MTFKEVVAPFKERNVVFYLIGGVFFFWSFWLIQLNLSWVLYKVTKSPLHLGLFGFLANIPMIVELPIAGFVADRFDRRKIILTALVVWVASTVLLLGFVLVHDIQLWVVLVAGIVYGSIFAFVKPASDALVCSVVERKEELHRVIGVNGASNKLMQFFASALNALLHMIWISFIAASALITSIVLSVISFFCFIQIKVPPQKKEETIDQPMHSLWAGFQFVFSYWPIWTTTIMSAISLGVVIALLFQLPIFAGAILSGNIQYLNYLYLAGGIGGMGGGFMLAMRMKSKGLLKLATIMMAVLGLALIGFALSSRLGLSLFFMFLIDGCCVFVFASCGASIQYLIEDEKRGRIMGIYSMFGIGFIPFANLLMGIFGNAFGIVATVIGAGVVCILAAIIYWLIIPKNKREVQKIFEEIDVVDPEIGGKLYFLSQRL